MSRGPGRPKADKNPLATKSSLLVAAINEFGGQGFSGASLSQIAKRAGTDVGLCRYYFGSKLDLWKAAVDHLAAQLATELVPFLEPGSRSPKEKMKDLIRWFVDMSQRWPEIHRIIVFEGTADEERSAYVVERLVQPFFIYIELLVSEIRQTEEGFADIPLRTLFFMITHGGSFPMALPRIFNGLPGRNIEEKEVLTDHAEAVIQIIFPGERD